MDITNNSEEKLGVVLMNTGTPASPDPADIKVYLTEFLADPFLIKVPRIIWLPILHGIIARTRPKKTSPRYQQIWTPQGTPIMVHTEAQCEALNQRLSQAGIPIICEVGMRYGHPNSADALRKLAAQGCKKAVGFPLFPVTSYCTVSTCEDAFLKSAKAVPNIEAAGVVHGYGANPLYQQALKASIREAWHYTPGSKLLFSFHSIPLNDVEAGDTYLTEIDALLTAVTTDLGIAQSDWGVGFHSRFEDSRSWVTPHPKTILEQWLDEGAQRVAIATPGFAADCLESLYDVDISLRQWFSTECQQRNLEPDFTYIPALNSREDHLDALFDIIANQRWNEG